MFKQWGTDIMVWIPTRIRWWGIQLEGLQSFFPVDVSLLSPFQVYDQWIRAIFRINIDDLLGNGFNETHLKAPFQTPSVQILMNSFFNFKLKFYKSFESLLECYFKMLFTALMAELIFCNPATLFFHSRGKSSNWMNFCSIFLLHSPWFWHTIINCFAIGALGLRSRHIWHIASRFSTFCRKFNNVYGSGGSPVAVWRRSGFVGSTRQNFLRFSLKP